MKKIVLYTFIIFISAIFIFPYYTEDEWSSVNNAKKFIFNLKNKQINANKNLRVKQSSNALYYSYEKEFLENKNIYQPQLEPRSIPPLYKYDVWSKGTFF